MKTIGYIFKDITRRKSTADLSQDLITQSVDFYYADRRTKNTTDNDWKILTTKNIHINVEHYCKQKNLDVNSPLLQHHMVRDKHTFINLTTKQRKMAFAELRYYGGKDTLDIQQDLTGDETYGGPDDYVAHPYYENKIKYLEKILKDNKIEYEEYVPQT